MTWLKKGETFTIAGVREKVPNPGRRRWHFWRPKFILGGLKVFHVVDAAEIKATEAKLIDMFWNQPRHVRILDLED